VLETEVNGPTFSTQPESTTPPINTTIPPHRAGSKSLI
jgi:hypothetical protein